MADVDDHDHGHGHDVDGPWDMAALSTAKSSSALSLHLVTEQISCVISSRDTFFLVGCRLVMESKLHYLYTHTLQICMHTHTHATNKHTDTDTLPKVQFSFQAFNSISDGSVMINKVTQAAVHSFWHFPLQKCTVNVLLCCRCASVSYQGMFTPR